MFKLLIFAGIILFLSLVALLVAILLRAIVLFPLRSAQAGFSKGVVRYRYSVAFTVLFLIYAVAAYTGFSWSRFQWVPETEIIDAAIQYAYPNTYAGLSDLQDDYSNFQPELAHWHEWIGELHDMAGLRAFLLTDYKVTLPDAVVIVDRSGKARSKREFSTSIEPDRLKQE